MSLPFSYHLVVRRNTRIFSVEDIMLPVGLVCSKHSSHLYYDQMLQRRWRFLCSLLLFSVAICGLHMIKYFSVRQRLHLLLEYALDFAIHFHSISWGVLLSFRFQICWLNVSAFLCTGFLKLCL